MNIFVLSHRSSFAALAAEMFRVLKVEYNFALVTRDMFTSVSLFYFACVTHARRWVDGGQQ